MPCSKIEDYYHLAGQRPRSQLEVMDSMPGLSDIVFDPPKLDIQLRPAEFE